MYLSTNDLGDGVNAYLATKNRVKWTREHPRAYRSKAKARKALVKAERDYKEAGNQLTTYLYLLATNLVKAYHMNMDKEDCVQELVLECLKKATFWDIRRGGAFNFFSTISVNCLRQMRRKENGRIKVTEDYAVHLDELGAYGE